MKQKFKNLVILLNVFSILFIVCAFSNPEQEISIPIATAEKYFSQIKKLCEKDNKKLWGENLYTPLLFVDMETRDVVANEPDKEGILKKQGTVYVGKFPENQIIANSTTTLGNKKYAMVIWQIINSKKLFRNSLFMHEMFHYQQPALKLNVLKELSNDHLDKMEARIYLKLEWLALDKAVNSSTDKEKKQAVEDALLFRQLRRDLYSCAKSENQLEIHEGLAEYTGIVLASNSKKDLKKLLKSDLDTQINSDSFVRSFAYYSGPAYGILLDEIDDNWRKNLKRTSDLGELLRESYNISIQTSNFDDRKDTYNYKEIYDFEQNKKEEQEKLIKEYKNKFLESPTVTITLEKPSIGFDPKTLVPLDDFGTVYPTITINDSFGTLEVTEGGCLFNWKTAIVSAKDISIQENEISGNGWTIKLNEDYSISKEEENYIIK